MGGTIALLTDFGTQDSYVGVMKGVMRRINPDADFIDITHAIPPQDVAGGAFALEGAYAFFPAGTTFLVVVDPGVGSTRRAVGVAAGGYHFVAPDNGVLSRVLRRFESVRAALLQNPAYQLPQVSSTFHGRDIFAPAAAHLAAGAPLAAFGPAVDDLVMLPVSDATWQHGRIRGQVIAVDHFGNVITNIGPVGWGNDGALHLTLAEGAHRLDPTRATIAAGSTRMQRINRRYSEAPTGEALVIVSSGGYVEIAVNQGHAAQRLGLRIGDEVVIEVKG